MGGVLTAATLWIGCSPPAQVPDDLGRRLDPTLASIQRNVFGPHCARPACHAGPAPESLLDLRAGRSLDSLVGVPSVQLPDLLRVEPGRADRSYLIRKLEDDAIVGEPMPRSDLRLPQEAIDVVRQWIDAGATD